MKTDLELAVEIAAGLLASGHYTYVDEQQDDEPSIKRWCLDDWKEHAERRRCMAHVVDAAFDVLEEIKSEQKIRSERQKRRLQKAAANLD
jgi:hypothetical protein